MVGSGDYTSAQLAQMAGSMINMKYGRDDELESDALGVRIAFEAGYESVEGFAPPEPFTLDELDPAGVMPERVYTKQELKAYLEHGRAKCRALLEALTEERAQRRCRFGRLEASVGEMLLDNMRHVQHHTAQLNLILRQVTDSAPRWVTRTTRV